MTHGRHSLMPAVCGTHMQQYDTLQALAYASSMRDTYAAV
jgi:hypothetical protein